jgi:geranylgeranyl diphosphate synthase type II
LEKIHRNKTGALIEFSAAAGAKIANVSEADLSIISDFGQRIGLLFQIVDDLLDITETTESLGKTAGKDINAEKATYPSIAGVQSARELALAVRDKAIGDLDGLSVADRVIRELPDYLYERKV